MDAAAVSKAALPDAPAPQPKLGKEAPEVGGSPGVADGRCRGPS